MRRGNKLTEENVLEIRSKRAAGATQVSLALEYGVTVNTIRSIEQGTTWRAVEMPAELQASEIERGQAALAARIAAGELESLVPQHTGDSLEALLGQQPDPLAEWRKRKAEAQNSNSQSSETAAGGDNGKHEDNGEGKAGL